MICGLKPLKMFWIVLFCLCFWRLDGDADAVKSVMEGDSVTLHTRHGKMMDNDRIQWWFKNKNTLIAEINVTANSVTVNNNYDRRFRGRLKVDRQTRCLTITNIRTGHAGLYGVQTNRMRKTFTVIVNARLPVLVISSNSSQCSSLSTGFNPNSSQTPHLNISELCHTCSDSVHCCDSVEAVIRLVLSALVGVAAAAAVIVLVYDIRSKRAEQDF
uniref:Immunoglobulin V-set domain-containing protein n=2 Tax=Cyprinus carpio carpio TaxID=630221 RepID=A0A9J7Z8U1_CYPCA